MLPIINKDHQSQNKDQIRTKILSKNRPITDQNQAKISKIQTLQTQAKQMQIRSAISKQKDIYLFIISQLKAGTSASINIDAPDIYIAI